MTKLISLILCAYSYFPANLFAINSTGQLISMDVIADSYSALSIVIVAVDNAVPPNQDVTVVVVNFSSPTSTPALPMTSLPMLTSTGPVTGNSEQQQSNLIALIVIGVGCGVLLLVVIVMLIFVCRK
jgi:hypothetical protein